MAEPGGSTAQSGFYFQNSIAALFLGMMIGKPDGRDSYSIVEVTNEASGKTIDVDDILIKYLDHHRTLIQAKENIDFSGETWEKMWLYIVRQLSGDFKDTDNITLYLGNKHPDFYAFQELCKRASGKERSDQWEITKQNHLCVLSDIQKAILSLKEKNLAEQNNEPSEQQKSYEFTWKPEWSEKSDEDLAVTILSRINVVIMTRDEIFSEGPSKMPPSNVEQALLFKVLRDYAAESAIYNEPIEVHNFRKKLRDELHIRINGTELLVLKEFEPVTLLIDDDKDFLMGDDNYPNESPKHTIRLPGYRIGKYPITKREFAVFVNDIGTFQSRNLDWKSNHPTNDELEQPVTGISFVDARKYCEWLSGKSDHNYRLPNEAEWEKAARGNDGRKYPWGDAWDKEKIEKENKSIYGCWNMVGNIYEWTCSLWGSDWKRPDEKYKYEWKQDDRNNPNAYRDIRRVLRGGPVTKNKGEVRCSKRTQDMINSIGTENGKYGFRVVMEINA